MARSAAWIWIDSGKTKTANATLSAYLPIGIPSITGNPNVGNLLTAAHPLTSGAAYSYQWFANNHPIGGATNKTLRVTPDMEGKRISVRVAGTRAQYLSTTRTSELTVKVLRSAVPSIAGSMAVGRTLTAKPGSWTTATTFTYQWYRSGSPIETATASTYKLTAADRDQRLAVVVKGHRSGYSTVAHMSPTTSRIAQIASPTIVGTPKVGSTLSISRGEWTPGTTFTYQWYANAAAIPGGTSATLRLTTVQSNATIRVRVTGAKSGYATFATRSASTAPVTR